MKPLFWTILLAVLVVVGGVIFGVGGLLLAPIVGAVALVALVIWLLERKAQHKPPLE